MFWPLQTWWSDQVHTETSPSQFCTLSHLPSSCCNDSLPNLLAHHDHGLTPLLSSSSLSWLSPNLSLKSKVCLIYLADLHHCLPSKWYSKGKVWLSPLAYLCPPLLLKQYPRPWCLIISSLPLSSVVVDATESLLGSVPPDLIQVIHLLWCRSTTQTIGAFDSLNTEVVLVPPGTDILQKWPRREVGKISAHHVSCKAGMWQKDRWERSGRTSGVYLMLDHIIFAFVFRSCCCYGWVGLYNDLERLVW